jgi:hypothetical protein
MSEHEIEVLNHIPFAIDLHALLSELRVSHDGEDAKAIHELADNAAALARPKAVYKVAYVQRRDGDSIHIDGVVFVSRVLSANLRNVQRVFPYVVTCGTELDQIEIPSADFTRKYWLDAIKGMALQASMKYLHSYVRRKYLLEKTATMSPGAADVDTWPIEQQKQLFSLFESVDDLIGVRLTDSLLMIPNKSVSGILFPTEINFKSCQVCRRENCPSRVAAFDEKLMKSYSRSS